jgi:succinyl-diaminopimelate desuccinylase
MLLRAGYKTTKSLIILPGCPIGNKILCFFFQVGSLYNHNTMKGLLKELIRAESTRQTGELAAAEVISAAFARSGVQARIDRWDQRRANIIARVESTGAREALLFACHLDVVPPGEAEWKHPPFAGIEGDGRVYGRGSTDMKGGIVAVVTAISETIASDKKLQGDIIFVALAGEETDSCGAERFVRDCGQMSAPAGVIIPEPTDFEIVTAHRGMLWSQVTTRGKAAHGSSPELGINAIGSMRSVLNELEGFQIDCEPHELLGRCSMSINTISGGKALNIVPDRCTIGVDIRTLPGQDHGQIITDIEKILARLRSTNPQFEADVSVVREVGPLETDCRCGFVRDFCSAVGVGRTRAVGFTTDGPHLASLGAPVVIFGPGKPDVCHKPDEYVEIEDLQKAVEYYKKVISKFLC